MDQKTFWFPSFKSGSKEAQKEFRAQCDKVSDKITILKSGALSVTLKCHDLAELISNYAIKNNSSVIKLLATKEKDIHSVIVEEILQGIRSGESMFGKNINTSLLKEKAESKTTKSKIISSLKMIRKNYSMNIDDKLDLTRVSAQNLVAISDNFKNINFDTLMDMKEKQIIKKEKEKEKRRKRIKQIAGGALAGAGAIAAIAAGGALAGAGGAAAKAGAAAMKKYKSGTYTEDSNALVARGGGGLRTYRRDGGPLELTDGSGGDRRTYRGAGGGGRRTYRGAGAEGGGRRTYRGAGGGSRASEFCGKYDCKTGEIRKKCYRRKASVLHPDRGGNTASMQELNRDYYNLDENSQNQPCD